MSEPGSTPTSSSMKPAGRTPGTETDASPKEMLSAATATVKQEAASFASSVQEKAKDQFDDRKGVATKTLDDFANAIRHAGDELAQNDQSTVGRVAKHAADGLEQLSRSVSDKRPEELLDAVREFGRSNPTAFIAGSVLVGIALGRFARSSENHPSRSTSTYVESQDFGRSVTGNGGQTSVGASGGDGVSQPAPFASEV
jgi:hypothetical protein